MSTPRTPESPAIAVVGASALFPGSPDAGSFWRNILEGRDLITDVPEDYWLIDDYYDPQPATPGKTYARRGGFIPRVDFDPLREGLPPRQLSSTDTAQLLALLLAQKVLDDAASVQFKKVDRKAISVILGVASATELVGLMAARLQRPNWTKALREAGLEESRVQDICSRIEATYPEWDESTFPGLLGNVVAGRIANRLDLGGTNCVVDAACASSLGAVAMAIQELQLGHSDLVLTGGVDTLNDIFMFMCFSQTPALSVTGDCRPFADAADGTMLGEGIGMLALRRLEDAERDGDRIYAVIRGIGSSSDGRAKSIYAPRAEGQELAIRRTYQAAEYGTGDIGLVEAHGTATRAGDLAEFEGLTRAFSDSGREDRQWCALGSIKSQIGHSKAAAGSASLFKVVMALHHKVLPPTIKVDQPNSRIDIAESPFYLNTEARPWIESPDRKRRGSVSSFGFGGSNFHLTVEEYGAESRDRFCSLPTHLIVASAGDTTSLLETIEILLKQLSTRPLIAVARDSQRAFKAGDEMRLAVLAGDAETAKQRLRMVQRRISESGSTPFSVPGQIHFATGHGRAKVAFLFPGQGSQYLNMGRELAVEFEAARRVWDLGAEVHVEGEGRIDRYVFPIPQFSDDARREQEERLKRTDRAQPAIGATSLALLRLLESVGVAPDAVGGHSFGEVTALRASGTIRSDTDALRVAARRGTLMNDAASVPGAMTAVATGADRIGEILGARSSNGVTLANLNSPRQSVVAGATASVEQFEAELASQGVAFRRLPVATAFHTEIVAASAIPFTDFLGEIEVQAPSIPVYSNTTALPYPTDGAGIRETLGNQLSHPVRFNQMIRQMHDDGCRTFVEVGPGSVLTRMVGDCLEGLDHRAIPTDIRGTDGRTSFVAALGALAVAGVPVDWEAFWAQYRESEFTEAGEALSPATVQINGSHFGRPYPPRGGAAALPAPNPEPVTPAAPTSQSTAPETPKDSVPAPTLGAATETLFVEMQRQMLEAQQEFTRVLGQSHDAFLRASEAAFGQLAGEGGVRFPEMPPRPAPAPPATSSPTAAPPPAPKPVATPPAAPTPERPAIDFAALLLEVVADKTGYPVDMLTLDMELEAGLGIDSIKRVEILSVLQEKVPELATVDTTELAALNTLGEIVQFSERMAPAVEQSPNRIGDTVSTTTSAAAGGDNAALLLGVVAEKTGYPAEMLSLDMELEAGLGIDSIKRVEILSVLQERVPELASVDTTELAGLNTLGEIVAFADRISGGAVAPAPTAPVPPIDFAALLLEVVADKTGYPAEMLTLDMELEAGLGIDSIKRVEILSVLQERLPALAQVDTTELAALNTLGEIVAFAERAGDRSAPPSAASQATVSTPEPQLVRRSPRWVDAPRSGLVTPGLLEADPLYLVGGPDALAEALAANLGGAGVRTERATKVPADARALVLLDGLDPALTSADQFRRSNETIFGQLKTCATTMKRGGRLLVTLQDTGGDFGRSGESGDRVWSAGIAAATKTAALEWPSVECKAIDIETGDRTATELGQAIAIELLAGGSLLEVGLAADGRRGTLELVDEPAEATDHPFEPEEVVVVSGGGRGVTAACIRELLTRTRLRVAVLGRRELMDEPAELQHLRTDAELKAALFAQAQAEGETITPQEIGSRVSGILANRELVANLAELAALAAEVRYYPCDVADADQVDSALSSIREDLGPIRGLVHAAGVVADREIENKAIDQFQRVFRTKVDGLTHLLEATAGDALRHLICFSSVAAWRGNAGQIDYAMANEVLNRVCRAEATRRGPECLVKSVGWGPWAGGMVDASLSHHFAERGVALIPLTDGARFFADEVTGRNGDFSEPLYGGGLGVDVASASDPRSTSVARFSALAHPELRDHAVREMPVVPMVSAISLALHAVHDHRPDLTLAGTSDLRVIRGITLDHFDGGWDDVTVAVEIDPSDQFAWVKLSDVDGTIRYSMRVDIGRVEPPVPSPSAESPESRQANDVQVYRSLFHGPAYRAIHELMGLSEGGCVAVLKSTGAVAGGWKIPLDLLDGGVQLPVFWSRELRNTLALPTAVERVRFIRTVAQDETLRCEAICTHSTELMSRWNLRYLDSAGLLVCGMENLELHHVV